MKVTFKSKIFVEENETYAPEFLLWTMDLPNGFIPRVGESVTLAGKFSGIVSSISHICGSYGDWSTEIGLKW